MSEQPKPLGLTSTEVAERIEAGRSNLTSRTTSRSLKTILRANLLTLFNGVVGGSFLLLLVLGQWKDALFGLAVISNALIGIVQEFRAKRALDALTLLHQPKARVLRDGAIQEIAVADVVLDDLLVLSPGDQLPADCMVVEATDLEVDESLLTGEAEPVGKGINDQLLAGSSVVAGRAYAKATVVGDQTYAGRLTSEVRGFSLVKSELRSAINRIIKWITWALIPLSVFALNGQMQAHGGWQVAFVDGTWREATVGSIASIIAMVPQGLVLMTSLAFAIAAVKLGSKNVLVQELPAVEVLARVDMICFDKTGTLTEGSIEFDAIEVFDHQSIVDYKSTLSHFASSNDANATARSLSDEFTEGRSAYVIDSVAFSSATKRSSYTFAKDGKRETWTLGAPEFVLASGEVLDRATLLASEANRVLALTVSSERGDVPVALLTFREKLRKDAADTIGYFKAQGVAVRIISGDSPATVRALAIRAGVELDGTAFDARNLPDSLDDIAKVLEQNQILGRVTPEQKRDIVLALQSRGHVVAMIGDGVNDMLALKKADLGIAMSTATAATRSVSNLVLLDGKFESLPGVVAEGRKVIANIERVSNLFLTKTAWSMTLAVIFGLAMMSFPFLPRQLSAIDGFTIGIPAFFLALLPNSKRYESGFLARALRFCVPAGLVIGLAVTALNLVQRNEATLTMQTATAVLLAITGVWVLTLLSLPFDRWRSVILAAMLVWAALVFTVPLAVDFFSFVPLSGALWQAVISLGLLACLCITAIWRWSVTKSSRSLVGD